eukprot:g13160.t1
MFFIGLACTIFGVHILAQRKTGDDSEDDDTHGPRYVKASSSRSGGTGGSGDWNDSKDKSDGENDADEHTSLLGYDDEEDADNYRTSTMTGSLNMPSASGVTGLVVASTPSRVIRGRHADPPALDLNDDSRLPSDRYSAQV